jgi:antitoxin MazE
MTSIQVSIVQVGNSKGIRLSKTLLDRYKITNKVELILENDYIVLKSVTESRKNWENAFVEMHKNGDDKLLIDSVFDGEKWD